MPWMESSTMSLRAEFVRLAQNQEANVRDLCRRFGISAKTGYKWLDRFKAGGDEALADRPRRPHQSPGRTSIQLEQLVCNLRGRHPAWGGRKIHARLLALGHRELPSPSTISDILRRNGLLLGEQSAKHTAFRRFEHPHPNDMWQMDFMGHFATDCCRCHALTVLDDCSRFCLGVRACSDEKTTTVQEQLRAMFRRYGLPRRILSDNGAPWGSIADSGYTIFSAWLIQLGICISHGRPCHPQTQGKDERFHRTLRAEAIGSRRFADLPDVQRCFDPWREIYNLERPHEALEMKTPASCYVASPRVFPETLPAIEYAAGDQVRSVCKDGYFSFRGSRYKISQAFIGQKIAIRPAQEDGIMKVYFCQQQVARIDLKQGKRI
jgi:transposase InsO family protein